MRKLAGAFVAILIFFAINTHAQTAMAAKYDVERYDITAKLNGIADSMDITAALKLINNGNAAGRSVTLRLSSHAKVNSATINGANATISQRPDNAPGLQIISLTPPGGIAPKAEVTVALTYTFTVIESAPNESLGVGDIVLLPDSAWVPIANTPILAHGQDQSPYTLNLSLPADEIGISGGVQKGSTFDETINGEPLLMAGHFVTLKSTDGRFEAFIPKGLEQKGTPQANRLFVEAGKIAKFYEGIFGKPIVGPIRFVFSSRAGGFACPSLVVFNESVARTDILDASTLELLATTIAKNYVGGQARVYERGWGFVSEGIPRYLAALYFGERFGAASEREVFSRFVRAYTSQGLVKRDLQLMAQTLVSSTFYQSVPVKGPLVVRIFEREVGRDKLLGTLRQLINVNSSDPATLDNWLTLLKQTGSPNIDAISKEWLEIAPNVDVAIGVPRQDGGVYKAAIRNFGTGDVKVDAVAITASGKQLRDSVVLNGDSRGFGMATFNTTEKITSVEVDPDKVLIQTNYDNDAWVLNPDPVQRQSDLTLFTEAVNSYTQRNFADAEAKLRQVVAIDPNNDLGHAWLARALAGQNGKGDEAIKEANAALAAQPPDLITYAWANFTIGEVSEARGQHDVALAAFNKAAQAQADYVSTKTARAAIITAEAASGKASSIDSSVQQFIGQLDKAMISGNSELIKPMLVAANMKKFATRVAVTHPTQWNTTILRTEQIDSDRVAVDVKLEAISGGKNESGTALYYLRRGNGGWQLDKIDLSDIK